MKNQITSRDYELLSAYLDNQLGAQERARFESRLNLEPELRQELHEISKTRLLLRNLPRLRAPHNYFINPEVVSKSFRVRTPIRLAPAYGIASAIATILLVLMIFGDRLLSSTSPAALAPASIAPTEFVEIVKEVEISVAPTTSPAEAAPMAMMEAPVPATSPPSLTTMKVGESELATPTTIYLDALPPTSTPEGSIFMLQEQTETATISCEDYYLSGNSQALSLSSICPTLTSSPSYFLEGIYATATPTSSTSETPLPDRTATPTLSPSSTPSPTSAPTEAPALIQEAAPETRIEAPLMPAPSDQAMDASNQTLAQSESSGIPGTTPNYEFIQYIVLAIELSLAAFAIIAGLIAIILRFRAGR
jgi:hypothetical protein